MLAGIILQLGKTVRVSLGSTADVVNSLAVGVRHPRGRVPGSLRPGGSSQAPTSEGKLQRNDGFRHLHGEATHGEFHEVVDSGHLPGDPVPLHPVRRCSPPCRLF